MSSIGWISILTASAPKIGRKAVTVATLLSSSDARIINTTTAVMSKNMLTPSSTFSSPLIHSETPVEVSAPEIARLPPKKSKMPHGTRIVSFQSRTNSSIFLLVGIRNNASAPMTAITASGSWKSRPIMTPICAAIKSLNTQQVATIPKTIAMAFSSKLITPSLANSSRTTSRTSVRTLEWRIYM